MELVNYNDTLCITGTALIKSERNPQGLVSKPMYDKMSRKDPALVARRANGVCPSLVVVDRLPTKHRDEIYRLSPDPKSQAEAGPYIASLENDPEAFSFFAGFTFAGTDQHLSDETQEEYVNNARVLNMLRRKLEDAVAMRKGRRVNYTEFFAMAAKALPRIADNLKGPMSLPQYPRRLEEAYRKYVNEGYASLISKRWMSQNAAKITQEAGDWIVARYSTRINAVTITQLWKEYNAKAEASGWKQLKSEKAIYIYLNREEIVPLWYASRYGELKAREKFGRQHRTLLPTMRDSLWYSDGTKLNYFYRDENGNVCTCNVYEVIDSYSEVFLGYHISKTEDYEAQFMAYKMALNISKHKPYEIVYDNQGGHKKLENGDFLKKLSHISRRTAPYNGRSKTIEYAFGRFQAEYLHRDWFFTGQNIQAKAIESKANVEFIAANSKNLPTLDEVKAVYKKRRDEWNNAPHFDTGKPRIEMYRESVNPQSPKLEIFDLISLFWITLDKKITYRASGIQVTIKGEKFAFEVLCDDGTPDASFRLKNVDRKFIVKYDPDDLTLIALYEDAPSGVRFSTLAQPYIKIHRGHQEQDADEAQFIKDMEIAGKMERVALQDSAEERQERNGLHPSQHGLNQPKLKGISKKEIERFDVGTYMKVVSNKTPRELEEAADKILSEIDFY